jgi:ElaB/YqjD/DUF883 family membrane-anchored ribosome-binding protein
MAETHKWKETTTSSASSPLGREGDQPAPDYTVELEKLRKDLTRLAESVGGAVQGAVQERVQPMAREFEATIARNPTTSVLVAAGVGLLLGMIVSR